MSEDKHIDVVVITPERQVLQESADSVVIPAHDGEIGIWHDRAALMCELGTGQFRYMRDGTTERVFIDRGFAQVCQNRVTVLTTRAMPATDITSDVIQQAEQDVESATGYSPEALAEREHAQRRLSALRSLQSSV